MQSKIVLSSIIFFLTATGATAQPSCNEPFSPFHICWSGFERYDYFFYGEVISLTPVRNVSVNSTYTPQKVVLEVKKSFKGKLPEKITVYLSANLTCAIPSKGGRYLFYAAGSELDGQKVYFSERISRPMTDYSPKAIEEVFAKIRPVLSKDKKDYIDGIVFENLLKTRDVTIKAEDADRISRDLRTYKPSMGALIELVGESDGKVYRTKSKADGSFKIDGVPNGRYTFNLYLQPSGEKEISRIYEAGDSFCSRTLYFYITPKASK